MRRLGARLGVEAMSLYRHVRDKADLLDALHAAVLGELRRARRGDATIGGRCWAGLSRALRAALLAHPNVVPLFATRPVSAPEALEPIVRVWAALGAARTFRRATPRRPSSSSASSPSATSSARPKRPCRRRALAAPAGRRRVSLRPRRAARRHRPQTQPPKRKSHDDARLPVRRGSPPSCSLVQHVDGAVSASSTRLPATATAICSRCACPASRRR